MTFKELGLDETVLEAIGHMGFEKATPIQEQAIPKILAGKDLLACAQTGTGKTGAFILPVISMLANKSEGKTVVLVLVPTRELAIQIDQQIQGFTYYANVESASVYGGGDGHDWEAQRKALKNGTEIIVATPGKLISFMQNGVFPSKTIKYLILDEADRMLDIGFYEDITGIIKKLPKDRQTLMFSATMPNKIKQLSKEILTDPDEISIAISKPAAGVLQAAYLVFENQKAELVTRLIGDKPNYKSILIFSSTKKKISQIVSALRRKNIPAEAISSDLDQKDREKVLRGFRSKRIRVLVATDVISRGIDIKDINLVINYDVPGDAADYVHRIGRTARADTTGVAITLINEDDMRDFGDIETLIEKEVAKLKLPPEMGDGPVWNTSYRKKSNFKGRSGGRSKGRSGGGKSSGPRRNGGRPPKRR